MRNLVRCIAVVSMMLLSGVLVPAASSSGSTPLSDQITWATEQTYPGLGVGTFNGISCPTLNDCVGIGTYAGGHDAILTSSDGGRTWQTEPLAFTIPSLEGISCPTTNECIAVGNTVIEISQDGGKTWLDTTEPGLIDLNGVSCANAQDCIAVGGTADSPYSGIIATTDGGMQWLSQSDPSSLTSLFAVSCATATACVAVGQNTAGQDAAAYTTDGGQLWVDSTVETPVGAFLTSVSCYTNQDCVVVGHTLGYTAILRSDNGGATWLSDTVPPNAGLLDVVSCAGRPRRIVTCAAGGLPTYNQTAGTMFRTVDGQSWVPTTVANTGSFPSVTAIDCATVSRCAAGGSVTGVASSLTTAAGGSAWRVRPFVRGVDVDYGESCPTAVECALAVYDSGNSAPGLFVRTPFWTREYYPTGVGYIQGVSCASSTSCVAVGENGSSSPTAVALVTTNAGATWTTVTLSTPMTSVALESVSCPTTSVCLAVSLGMGQEYMDTTDDGGLTWNAQQVIPTGISTVSCFDSDSCVAVGYDGAIATSNGGQTWSALQSIGEQADAVTCASSTFCVAVGTGISTTQDGGATWQPNSFSDNETLNSVSCLSTSECVAVGGRPPYGTATAIHTTDGGATWAADELPAATPDLFAVSCPTAQACQAIGSTADSVNAAFSVLDGRPIPS